MIKYEDKFYANMREAMDHIKAAEHQNNFGTPKPWPKTDPNEIMAYRQINEGMGAGKTTFHFGRLFGGGSMPVAQQTLFYISGQSHFSTKPLDQLKPIKLEQMKVPYIHQGRFLACRVVSNADVDAIGTKCLTMDNDGNVEYVKLYNCNANMKNTGWLKKGTILVIKEPQMKYGPMSRAAHNNASMDDEVFISVQYPTDVLFVHETDKDMLQKIGAMKWYIPEKQSSEALKTSGNQAFQKGDYEVALEFYKRALAVANGEMIGILHLNMAAALLQLERFYEANKEIEIALNCGNVNKEKALFRLGRAAYGMRDWQKSGEWFKQLIAEFPTGNASKEAVEWLAKVEARQKEAATGQYDMLALFEATKRRQKNMDAADFVGPVKVVDIPGKGKGLVATKDLPKGTLLAATKAYAFCAEYNPDYQNLEGYNPISKGFCKSSEVQCILETIQKLKRNPQTAKQIYALYAGPNMDRGENIPEGVIDVGRIEKICAFNDYGCIDILNNTGDYFKENRDIATTANMSSTGLWILPSYVNHSCLANTTRVFYGDMYFLYATKDVKAGEEITAQYTFSTLTKNEREQMLRQKWQFQCKCKLCELDRQKPNEAKKREATMEKIEKLAQAVFENPKRWLNQLLELIKEMRQTYPDQCDMGMKTQLGEALTLLAQVYMQLGQKQKAIDVMEEIAAIEIASNASAMKTYKMMIDLYLDGFRPAKVQDAKRVAERAYQDAMLTQGVTDKGMFKRVFPEFPDF